MTALTETERDTLARAIAAAANYHSFDAGLEMADFDLANALVDTTTAASAPGGLVAAVEAIIAARLAPIEALADGWSTETKDAQLAGVANPLSSKRAHVRALRAALAPVSPEDQGAARAHHPDCPALYFTDHPERCRCMFLAALDRPTPPGSGDDQ